MAESLIAGETYWHDTHGCLVRASHTSKRDGKRAWLATRLCNCGRTTRSLKEPNCPNCGGKKQELPQTRPTCVGKGGTCGKTAHNKEPDVGPLCPYCWVAIDVSTRGCPGCAREPRSRKRDDGLCAHCFSKAETKARREARMPEMDALLATEPNTLLAEPTGGAKAAEPKQRYVVLNQKDNYAPHIMVKISEGVKAQWAHACQVQGCVHEAVANPQTGTCTHCPGHGGGRRCKGSIDPQTQQVHACADDVSVQKGNSDKYDGHCARCFCMSFPNDPRAKEAKSRALAREQEVVAILTDAFPQYRWLLNRGFTSGVPKRPDAMVRKRDRVVIVEIDEDSHRTYNCGKEREREAVFRAHTADNVDIVMVRFNPDGYTDVATGVRNPTCFKYSPKLGLTTIDPAQRAQWEARCAALIYSVGLWLDSETLIPPPDPGRVVFTVELFYDDVNGLTSEQKACAEAKWHAIRKARKARKREAEAANDAAKPSHVGKAVMTPEK